MDPQAKPKPTIANHGQNSEKRAAQITKPKSAKPGTVRKVFKPKDELCPYCNILLPLESIDSHHRNCKKKPKPTSTRQVVVYNSAEARMQGTEVEKFLREKEQKCWWEKQPRSNGVSSSSAPVVAKTQDPGFKSTASLPTAFKKAGKQEIYSSLKASYNVQKPTVAKNIRERLNPATLNKKPVEIYCSLKLQHSRTNCHESDETPPRSDSRGDADSESDCENKIPTAVISSPIITTFAPIKK